MGIALKSVEQNREPICSIRVDLKLHIETEVLTGVRGSGGRTATLRIEVKVIDLLGKL